MAITNHERVGKALAQLKEGLSPFVEREVNAQLTLIYCLFSSSKVTQMIQFLPIEKLGIGMWQLS